MPYSPEQIKAYNTLPSNYTEHNTIEIYNPIAGYKRMLISGIHGPYKPMSFLAKNGNMEVFLPVSASAPPVVKQDTTSSTVGTIVFSRISSDAKRYLRAIMKGAVKPSDRVNQVRIALYTNPYREPVYARDLYVSSEGISMNSTDVSMELEFDNLNKIGYNSIYTSELYTGI